MSLRRETVSITATGGAGTSTGTVFTKNVVNGDIVGIYIDYDAAAPATVDVTIIEGTNVPPLPVLTATDLNTDAWFFALHAAKNEAGVAITNEGTCLCAYDRLKITIAQANNNQVYLVTILWSTDDDDD